MTPKKLFLIVRADLSPGQQAVQAAHALQAFNIAHPGPTKNWYETSNTLALLEVEDESALKSLLERARWKGISASAFYEPDRDNELTAIALGPDGKRLCQALDLALQRVA